MATEIKVPALGESVTEATVAKWLKKLGDPVAVDDPVVELETDKVTLEVNATAAGAITEISAPEGANVTVGGILGMIGEGGPKPASAAKPAAKAPAAETASAGPQAAKPAKPAAAAAPAAATLERSGPAVRRLVAESGIDPGTLQPSGKDGRLTKGDLLAAAEPAPAPAPAAPATSAPLAP